MQQGNEGQGTAVAALKRRMAEVEEINQELLAFARGHAGAVASIHEAVLALLTAHDRDSLVRVVTRDWPAQLGVDTVAMVWSADGAAFVADVLGRQSVEPRLVARMAGMNRAVTVREVARGHPLFGAEAEAIRAEVLVRLDGARGVGLVLLGQRSGSAGDAPAGARLLRFLGRAVAAMLERWPALHP